MVRNTARRLDGRDPDLLPYPGTTHDHYGWYYVHPQLDSWAYWVFPAHGPRTLLLIVPVFLAMAAYGAKGVAAGLRRTGDTAES